MNRSEDAMELKEPSEHGAMRAWDGIEVASGIVAGSLMMEGIITAMNNGWILGLFLNLIKKQAWG